MHSLLYSDRFCKERQLLKMSNLDTILRFLKLLRVLGCFPYKWNFQKDHLDENLKLRPKNNSKLALSDIELKFKFKKCKILTIFSFSLFILVVGFAVFRIYMILGLEIGKKLLTTTYKISFPIFGGTLHLCSILIMTHISSKSLDLSKIFSRIVRIILIHSPLKLSLRFKQFHFIIYLISYLIVLLSNLVKIFRRLANMNFMYLLNSIYYICIQTQIFLVLIEFRVVCLCYSHIIKKYLNEFPKKKLMKFEKIPNIKIVEQNLEISIPKFRELSQHQKLLNSYFGPLISYMLIFHICWLILFPLVLSSNLDAGKSKFTDIAKSILLFIWPCLDIYFISATPDLLMKKVRLLSQKLSFL